jgi:hypothetical protein
MAFFGKRKIFMSLNLKKKEICKNIAWIYKGSKKKVRSWCIEAKIKSYVRVFIYIENHSIVYVEFKL